jgi:glycosyltransferase involved in cell wall biosynthesis
MRVAYIHTGDWPSNSPSITFSTYNCLALSKQTSECHFFIKRNFQGKVETIFREFFDVEKPNNLIIHDTKKPIINSNEIYYQQIYLSLKQLINKGKVDAVISRNVSSLPLLIKLKHQYDVRVYYETHDFFSDLSLRDDLNPKRKKRQSLLEKKFIPHLNGLICLQETQKKLYKKIFPECDIQVFRTGFLKHEMSDKKRKYITYIGSLDKNKGVNILLDALNYCQSQLEVLIIGGKSEAEINRVINNHPEIKVTGWINKKMVKQYLKETAIGIVPLRDTFFNRHITSPLKIFDYFGHGIPIISSDLDTTRELITENQTGLFFEVENPKHLATQIDFLINNVDKLRQMEKKIYKNTGHFTWEKRAKSLLNWLEGVKNE